jgi:hypothetical protein
MRLKARDIELIRLELDGGISNDRLYAKFPGLKYDQITRIKDNDMFHQVPLNPKARTAFLEHHFGSE